MQNIFDQAITNVNAAFPSIYTKEDVIKLITDLSHAAKQEELNRPEISPEDVSNTLLEIQEQMRKSLMRVCFEDYVSLELGYDNRIEISVDENGLINQIEEAFDEAAEQYLAPKE